MTTAIDRLRADAPLPEHPARLAAIAVLFGAAYVALALFAIGLPVQAPFSHLIWPADGLALGVLLEAPLRRWGIYLGIVFATSLALALGAGAAWNASLAAAAMNVVIPCVVALGLTRLSGARVNLGSLLGMASFLIGMVPLVAGLSLLGAAVAWYQLGTPLREQWSVTFVSNFVGMITIAPLVVAWSRGGWREALATTRAQLPELAVL